MPTFIRLRGIRNTLKLHVNKNCDHQTLTTRALRGINMKNTDNLIVLRSRFFSENAITFFQQVLRSNNWDNNWGKTSDKFTFIYLKDTDDVNLVRSLDF